jgi:hypothetical protein
VFVIAAFLEIAHFAAWEQPDLLTEEMRWIQVPAQLVRDVQTLAAGRTARQGLRRAPSYSHRADRLTANSCEV